MAHTVVVITTLFTLAQVLVVVQAVVVRLTLLDNSLLEQQVKVTLETTDTKTQVEEHRAQAVVAVVLEALLQTVELQTLVVLVVLVLLTAQP